MDVDERYSLLGKEYWWFLGKYRLVLSLFSPYLRTLPEWGLRIYDAGCGSGFLLDWFSQVGWAVGSDYSFKRLQFCRSQGHEFLAQVDLRAVSFLDNTFDWITLIDVLEHIEDDRQALKELYRVLKPGGWLTLTVPAWMILWGEHDCNQGHFRRYRTEEMRERLQEAGFIVERASYAEILWFLPLLILRKIGNWRRRNSPQPEPARDDFRILPRWLNRLLTGAIHSEWIWLRWLNLPFGVTMICFARKPAKPT